MSGGFSRLPDEREREWRHRVTYVGFQILGYLRIIAMIYGLLVAHTEEGGLRGWALPDDDPDDFEEGMGHD